MTWTTDNRFGGVRGAEVPEDALAVYEARWIDLGDYTPADILGDRQGFAYNDPEHRDALIKLLVDDDKQIRDVYALRRETATHSGIEITVHPSWSIARRRAGGYIYVSAWLVPS